MADKDPADGPSLELPKLFGRKKKDKTRRCLDESATQPVEGPREAESPSATDERPLEAPAQPAGEAPVEPAEEPAAAAEPPAAAEPTAAIPAVDAPVDPAEATMPLPVPAPERIASEQPAPGQATTDEAVPEQAVSDQEPASQPRRRREPAVPSIPSGPAAVLVGAVVGMLGILLTWLGLLGCEAIRGTESCGGPGLVVMLAIMVVMVVVGAALLKLLGVPQGGSLSFLGFGILAVVVLTFLLDHLDNVWVLVSIPVISAVGYGVAHWVTTRFTEPDPDFTH